MDFSGEDDEADEMEGLVNEEEASDFEEPSSKKAANKG
jgi:hypothetical protein